MSSFGKSLACLCVLVVGMPLHAENRADSSPPSGSRSVWDDYPEVREVGGRSFDQWRKDLVDPDPSVRARAIQNIIAFGKLARDIVPLLIDRTKDADASPRVKAVLALQILPIDPKDAAKVAETLGHRVAHDSQAIVRYEAAKALYLRFGDEMRKNPAILADLVRGVGDGSSFEMRSACIHALRVGADPKKGPDPRVTNALLLRLNIVQEPTTQVRLEAVMALGALGRPQDPELAKQVFRALETNFRSRNKIIRLWSHVSTMFLEEKVNEGYLKVVDEYLNDHEREMRAQGVAAFGALGEKAKAYVPDVVRMLKDPETDVVVATCGALVGMHDSSSKVVDALIEVTRRDVDIKGLPMILAACNALGQMGTGNAEVIEAIKKVLNRKDIDDQSREALKQHLQNLQNPKKADKR
jgi:HEAT repeat protein